MGILSLGRALSSSPLKMKFVKGLPGAAGLQLKNFDWKSYYDIYKPEEETDMTEFVRALSTCTVSQLDSGLQLITLPPETAFPAVLVKSTDRYLYCRSFYPELLKTIRSSLRNVLVSNPGTGKSMFQWYYLARLLNPDAFNDDALTANIKGNTEPPEVVIRQLNVYCFEIYFIKAKVCHIIHEYRPSVMSLFDPATTVYFFEPGGSTVEPSWEGTRMSILATCPPEIIRFKEFCKNGARKVYMPLYTGDELLTIGRHMRQQPDFPARLSELYSDANIRQSFFEFGGIIRHVLPCSPTVQKQLKEERRRVLLDVKWREYFASAYIHSPRVNFFVVKCESAPPNFNDVSFESVSEDVECRAIDYIKELTVHDQIDLLKKFGNSNMLQAAVAPIYKVFVSKLLVDGVSLVRRSMQQSAADGHTDTETLFTPKLAPRVSTCKKLPLFQDMKMRTLYKSPPPAANFPPFADFYYKDKIVEEEPEDALITLTRRNDGAGGAVRVSSVPNVQLVGINTCLGRSKKSLKIKRNFPAFKEALRLPDQLLVDYLFCPHPLVVSDASATWAAERWSFPPVPCSMFLSCRYRNRCCQERGSRRRRGLLLAAHSRSTKKLFSFFFERGVC